MELRWTDATTFRESEGRLHVERQAPARTLAERLGWELDEQHESTVGGYLSEQLGRVPEVGETVDCHGWKAEILAVEETRITSLAVYKDDEPQAN